MQYSLTINGHEHTLDLTPGNVLSCRLDGAPFEADAAQVGPGVFSMLIGGKSFHVRIAPSLEPAGNTATPDSTFYNAQIGGAQYTVAVQDQRQWSRARGGLLREGRQQITAPMPGKVVRILVTEGQRVEAAQGLIVVEAMKMQNEIKSPASGTVEKILAVEGQPVTAGESLLTIA